MTNYKISWRKRGKSFESAPMPMSEAFAKANEVDAESSAVVISKESDGSDHPDNRGKFYLYRIIK